MRPYGGGVVEEEERGEREVDAPVRQETNCQRQSAQHRARGRAKTSVLSESSCEDMMQRLGGRKVVVSQSGAWWPRCGRAAMQGEAPPRGGGRGPPRVCQRGVGNAQDVKCRHLTYLADGGKPPPAAPLKDARARVSVMRDMRRKRGGVAAAMPGGGWGAERGTALRRAALA